MIRSCGTCVYRDHLGDEYPCIDCDEWENHYEPKEKTNQYELKNANRNKMVRCYLIWSLICPTTTAMTNA